MRPCELFQRPALSPKRSRIRSNSAPKAAAPTSTGLVNKWLKPAYFTLKKHNYDILIDNSKDTPKTTEKFYSTRWLERTPLGLYLVTNRILCNEQWTTFTDEFKKILVKELLFLTTALYEDSPDKTESTDNILYVACFFKLSLRVLSYIILYLVLSFTFPLRLILYKIWTNGIRSMFWGPGAHFFQL